MRPVAEGGSPRAFTRLGSETVYSGHLLDVRVGRFRHADGETVVREFVHHQGAVGILAHDDEHVWLVRQPRESVRDADLLEIPAGRLDVEGEEPLQTAMRELAEEVGLGAQEWEPMLDYFSSAGSSDERVYLFRARGLHPRHEDSGENERIEVVQWPLAELESAIAECRDAKTLIALMWLQHRLRAGG